MWNFLISTVISSLITSLLAPSKKMKAGSLDDFGIPQIEDGSPTYYLAGTTRIKSPNLIWYGALGTKPIKKPVSLFKKQVVGYKYYLGMQFGLCIGPGVRIRKVWFGKDDPIWVGDSGEGTFSATNMTAFGGDNGSGGYSLDFRFYSGSSTQGVDSYLQSVINGGSAIVPAWRGFSYLVAYGYIGNAPSLQSVSVELQKIPDPLGLGVKAYIGTEGDANPANVMYDIMTNNFGGGAIPASRVEISDFIALGNLFYDEDEGCTVYVGGSPGELKAVLSDLQEQTNCIIYEEPETGKFRAKAIREDYAVDDLQVINADNIVDMGDYATNLWADTKNKVRISFEDRAKNYENRIATLDDTANMGFQGGKVKPVNIERKFIKRAAHANRKAADEMATYSTQIASVRTSVTREFHRVRPGTVVKMTYGKYKIQSLVLRVSKVNLGSLENGQIVLEMVADKFAIAKTVYAPTPAPNFDPPTTGAQSVVKMKLVEAPRWFNAVQSDVIDPDAPRALALPVRPSDSQLSYNLYAKTSTETTYGEVDTEVGFVAFGTLYAAYPQSYNYDTSVGLELASLNDTDVLEEATQSQIANGQNLIMVDDEIMAYETFQNIGGRWFLRGIHRGLLDTVPAAHSASARVYWLGPENVANREFRETDTVNTVVASQAMTGSQDETDGVALTLPGEI